MNIVNITSSFVPVERLFNEVKPRKFMCLTVIIWRYIILLLI